MTFLCYYCTLFGIITHFFGIIAHFLAIIEHFFAIITHFLLLLHTFLLLLHSFLLLLHSFWYYWTLFCYYCTLFGCYYTVFNGGQPNFQQISIPALKFYIGTHQMQHSGPTKVKSDQKDIAPFKIFPCVWQSCYIVMIRKTISSHVHAHVSAITSLLLFKCKLIILC